LIIRLFGNLKVIILFTGVIFPDYLIPKVISDYLSIAFREKLMITVAKHVIILVIIRSLATPYAGQCLKWTVAQSPNATNILFGRLKAAPN
jgi:hypothetical protein